MELKAKVEKRFFRGIPESLDFPIAPNWPKKIPGYILEVLVRTSSELFQERGRSRGGRLASREQGQCRVQVSGQGLRADDDAHHRPEGVPCSGVRNRPVNLRVKLLVRITPIFQDVANVSINMHNVVVQPITDLSCLL